MKLHIYVLQKYSFLLEYNKFFISSFHSDKQYKETSKW